MLQQAIVFLLLLYATTTITTTTAARASLHDEEDDYLRDLRQRCDQGTSSIPCLQHSFLATAKHRLWRGLATNSSGWLNLVQMDHPEAGEAIFPRQYSNQSMFGRFTNFLARQANLLLSSRALAVDLPAGTTFREIGDARLAKKKQILVPLLVLLKLYKIKMTVVFILVIVLFLKKAALIAAFALPSILSHYHICRIPHHDHHHHHDHEEHHDQHSHGSHLAYNGYSNSYGA